MLKTMLNHRVTFYRRVETRGAARSAKYTWGPPTADETNVECQIEAPSATELKIAKEQENYVIRHTLWFDYDPTLEFMDRIKYTNPNTDAVRIFQVVTRAINPQEMDDSRAIWKIECQEIQWQQIAAAGDMVEA